LGKGQCWYCNGFCDMTAQGSAALCDRPGHARVISRPQCGCVSYSREPGSDDEAFRFVLTLPTLVAVVAEQRVEWAP
jgi:hypothetical protein